MIETGLIAARVATYAAVMLAAGIPLYLLAAGRTAALEGRACRAAGIAALSARWLL